MAEYERKVKEAREAAEKRRKELIKQRDEEVAKKRKQIKAELDREVARRRAEAERIRAEKIQKKIAGKW